MADDRSGTGRPDDGGPPDPWERAFDEGFVAGARYQEPSADERVRDLKAEGDRIKRERKQQKRQTRKADFRGRVARWWPWAVFIALAVGLVLFQELR